MKKTVLFLFLAAGLLSCSKEPVQQEKTFAGVPMKFEINVADTKAAKDAWAEGDVVYVFFNGITDKYLTLTCESDGSWTNTPSEELTDADFSGLTTQTLTAVHLPVEVIVFDDEDKFQFADFTTLEPFNSYYLSDENREYEVDGTTVKATLKMELPANLTVFFLPGNTMDINDSFAFSCSLFQPVVFNGVSKDGVISESFLQPGVYKSGIPGPHMGRFFTGQLTNPGAEADYVFTVADTDKIYTLYRENRKLEGGKIYNFPGLYDETWKPADRSVDMGNGLKWATMNVGATSPEDYGNYYAWGEVSTKSIDYVYSNYAWAVSVDNDLTKYCSVSSYGNGGFTDTLTELVSADDAATVNWQHGWRIPTKDDWDALLNDTNFDRDWTSNYNETGISGLVITSKIDGYVGNSIFLPAAGYKTNTTVDLGTYGSYWTSSLYTTYPNNAYVFTFKSSSNRTTYYGRAQGHAVRPVHD